MLVMCTNKPQNVNVYMMLCAASSGALGVTSLWCCNFGGHGLKSLGTLDLEKGEKAVCMLCQVRLRYNQSIKGKHSTQDYRYWLKALNTFCKPTCFLDVGLVNEMPL